MKKILLITFITLFFIVSCVKENNTGDKITKSKEEIREIKSVKIDARKEEAKTKLLENVTFETKKLFLELEEIRKTWNKIKEKDKLEEIKKLEESKRLDLDLAVKSGNMENINFLKNELIIFSELY